MVPNMPAIGVRFDIDKLKRGDYGTASWKIFWRAIEPDQLPCTVLFEGDTGASINDRENVFCVAIQGWDETIVERVKLALIQSDEFHEVCGRPRFVEGDACCAEPLPRVNEIDHAGNLTRPDSNATQCR